MKSFRFKTENLLKGTILVAIIVFIVNAVVFSPTTSIQDNEYKINLKVRKFLFDHLETNITPVSSVAVRTTVGLIPRSNEVAYKNPFWQVHVSLVKPNCSTSGNVKSESVDGKNKCDNRSDEYEEVIVYNSFYDDRPTSNSSRWVRILGVLKIAPNPRQLYCKVWLKFTGNVINSVNRSDKRENSKVVLINLNVVPSSHPSWLAEMPTVSHLTGRDHYLDDVSYGQRLFSCPLNDIDSTLMPTHVSLAFERGERSTIFLPVEYSKNSINSSKISQRGSNRQSSFEHEFVVCVTQAYGQNNAQEMIEWMEFHNLLGVTKINIYNGSMVPDPSLESVFQHYVETGLLSLHSIPPVLANQKNPVEATKLSSPASLNDCMMRYMNTARWIIVVDFDEIIVPVKAMNYSDMMNEVKIIENQPQTLKHHLPENNKQQTKQIKITNTPTNSNKLVQHSNTSDQETSLTRVDFKYHTYLFLMAYFMRNSGKNDQVEQKSELLTSQYRWRSKVHGPDFGPKPFVNPRHCLSVFNHYCYITLTEKLEKLNTVDLNVAIVQHYRKTCGMSEEECNKLEKEKVFDNNVERFEKDLLFRVEKTKKKLFH